jgi:HAE1 family hydrophobic/amphiphilic exporter-1
VRRLGLTVKKRNPTLLMVVGVSSPGGTHGIQFLDNYTNVYIKDALQRVKGVGDIFVRTDDFSMRVWLRPDKLAQLGLTAGEVVAALQEQNVQVAAGSVGAPPQQSTQAFEYTVFVNGRLNREEEFGSIIVRTKPEDGSIVYLRDIARVELGRFGYSSNSFIDGKRAAFLVIFPTPGSNALDTYEGILETMEKLKKSFPKDVAYSVPFESVSVVEVSIEEVIETLVIALTLVILVVFLFLQSWRATLIPLLAIPVSIIGTFIFFIPLGFTINTLTLFGFVLAIGIVVDDAIVVVEAVQHYIDEEGLSPREATIKAMKDISGPVIAIALILAAVFVPVGFIPGIVGRLYQQFAVTIAISVLISAFVALSLTPALCTLILRPMHLNAQSKGLNQFFYRFNGWFARLTGSYTNGVRRSIRATPLVLVLLVCICVATVVLFGRKPSGFIPQEDEGRLYITFQLPEAASTGRTVAVLRAVMREIEQVPAIAHYAAISGLNVVTFSSKSNSGTVFCQLRPWAEREDEAGQIAGITGELYRRFAKIEEADIFVIAPPAIPGLGNTGGFSLMVEQTESTDDIKGFERVVQAYMTAANGRPEIASAYTFFTARTPSYQVNVDREKCKKLGVSLSDVFNTMQTFLGSRYINDFSLYGRNFRVVAQADTSYRTDIKDLTGYYVRNVAGLMVPLSTLVSYNVTENAPLISHYNLFRSVEFNGDAGPGYSSGQAARALQEVAAQVLPTGYSYEFSGLSREETQSGSSTTIIFALSILFVFLFLVALYESWSVPFSVLLAVPLGIFGAILTLTLLPGLTNNVYAQIGMITLIGLAAKNAILIVEYAKERLEGGKELVAATLEAVELRLRPIIMTSLAFILGVLPLAFSSGAGAVSRQTIGWTVFGGMLAATSLAIFVVPVLYVVVTRLAYGRRKLTALQTGQATPSRPEA